MRTQPPNPPRQNHAEQPLPRWVLPILGLVTLALAAFAYLADLELYFHTLTILILIPYPKPFIDGQTIPTAVDCWKHGVDVYVSAPCDPLQRLFPYSPLWLRARFIPAWTNWIGIGLDSLWLISLALLPRARPPAGAVVLILALFSGMSVLALERCNMDVVMFILIITGAWLWSRSLPLRLAGYLLFAFAGLLKFYPLILFLLFIRERIAIMLALGFAGVAILAAFIWRFHAELREMSRNIPSFSNFTDAFGAIELPRGLHPALVYLFPGQSPLSLFAQHLHGAVVLAALIATSITITVRLATRKDVASAFAALAPDERSCLVIGAAIFCGCFFTGESFVYRGVFFLLVLPGLLGLCQSPGTSRTFGATVAAVIFVMWGLSLQLLVAVSLGGNAFPMGGSVAIYLYWIFRELTWWWIISVFMAILICFIAQSPAWRFLRRHARISR
jgi:hypothetical protein